MSDEIQPVPSMGSMGRVAVLADVQSLFFAAKSAAQSKVEYGKLLTSLVGNRQLTRAIAYVAQREQANGNGFCDALIRFGYEVRRKDLPARMENDPQAKWSWAAGISVDALALAPRVDTIVIASCDASLAPLAEALKASGCRVEIHGIERAVSPDLARSCSEFTPIRTACLFREPKFATPAAAAPTGPKRNPRYDGLPDDDELDQEAAALAARG